MDLCLYRQIKEPRLSSRLIFIARLFSYLLGSLLVNPANAQVNEDKIRDLGAGGLSHEQRYQALAIRTDAVWDNVQKTLKEFTVSSNPELQLRTLRNELNGLQSQVTEPTAPIRIRKDVDELKQEIATLRAGLASASRADLAKKAGALEANVGNLVAELGAIGQACQQLIAESVTWKKEYDLSIQVQGEDVARKELKNLGVKASEKLEKSRQQYKRARLQPPPAQPSSQAERPKNLRTLPLTELQALVDQESAQPVVDKAWLKELFEELKVRRSHIEDVKKELQKNLHADPASAKPTVRA